MYSVINQKKQLKMENPEFLDIDQEAKAFGYENAELQPSFDLVVAKESAIPATQGIIDTLTNGVDLGFLNPLDAYAVFDKLSKMLDSAKKQVQADAISEALKEDKSFTRQGVQFTYTEGRKSLNYSEDEVIQELTEKLKERESLLKVALASTQPIYDSEGVEVPKVSVKYSASSLTAKFK